MSGQTNKLDGVEPTTIPIVHYANELADRQTYVVVVVVVVVY
jgi:hypothetical protein